MREAAHRLGLGARTVIFGHTHRAGPLPTDDPGEWSGLVNTGSWVLDHFAGRAGSRSPYWPGSAVALGEDGVPTLLPLLDDIGPDALRRPRPG
jgi:hypothetical protein